MTKSIERTSTWFQTQAAELKGEGAPFLFGVGVAIPELPDHISKSCSDLIAQGAKGINQITCSFSCDLVCIEMIDVIALYVW